MAQGGGSGNEKRQNEKVLKAQKHHLYEKELRESANEPYLYL